MKIVYAAAAAIVVGGTAGWFWPSQAQEQTPPPAGQGGPPPAGMERGGPPPDQGAPPAGAAEQGGGSMQAPQAGVMQGPPGAMEPSAPQGAQGSGHMPMDTPVNVNGTESVCTGIGEHTQQDPRWLAYPVRIDFSNRGAQFLSGAHVELSTGSGHVIASVDCDGAIVLFRVPPGVYRVNAKLLSQPGGGSASASFAAPASGQKRVVLDFSLGANQ